MASHIDDGVTEIRWDECDERVRQELWEFRQDWGVTEGTVVRYVLHRWLAIVAAAEDAAREVEKWASGHYEEEYTQCLMRDFRGVLHLVNEAAGSRGQELERALKDGVLGACFGDGRPVGKAADDQGDGTQDEEEDSEDGTSTEGHGPGVN